MKRRALKIDWDELESAFNNRNDELVYYLDLVTGHVVLEGEGDDFDEDSVDDPDLDAGRSDTTRLYIEPPGFEEEVGWMREFVREGVGDLEEDVVVALKSAVDGEDASAAFREMLQQHEDARTAWFRYRSERLHEAVEAWLDANEVRSVTPPPWRG